MEFAELVLKWGNVTEEYYATGCELVHEPPRLKPDFPFESAEQLHAQSCAVADADGMEVEASETSK